MNYALDKVKVMSPQNLFNDLSKNRLYTYKVQHDGGSAPNPYNGVCTLAICKPAIRRTAKPGDVVVGFGCKSNGDNELRIVYCMVVDEEITWDEYIRYCSSGLLDKIPKNSDDPGDCIWKSAKEIIPNDPRDSWSRHDASDFRRDVISGEKVLLSRNYWYFGSASIICIPVDMLPLLGRGHRSASNDGCRIKFQDYFCTELQKIPLPKIPRIYGEPWYPPAFSDARKCARSRIAERESDQVEEDVDQIEEPHVQITSIENRSHSGTVKN